MNLYNDKIKTLYFLLAISLLVSTRAWGASTIVDWSLTTGNATMGEISQFGYVTYAAKAWIVGGLNGSAVRDEVWNSQNGSTWNAVTLSAGIGEVGNRGLRAISLNYFNNKFYIIGGDGATGRNNNIFSSVDGATWVDEGDLIGALVTGAVTNGALVLNFNSKLYVISGGIRNSYTKDVYEFDGTDWLVTTRNGAFSPVGNFGGYHGCVYDSKMWLIGGENNAQVDTAEVWYSTDGADWTCATKNAEFGIAVNHSVTVVNSKMYIIGNYNNAGKIYSSADGIVWTAEANIEQTGADQTIFNTGFFSMNNNVFYVGGARKLNSVKSKDVWIARMSTATFTPTITKTTYVTRTKTPTASVTQTNSSTATRTSTRTPSFTVTKTGTITITRTPTYTKTVTQTNTPIVTFTNTQTITQTHTFSPTYTPTDTITETWTVSETHTFSPTSTVTMTPTPIETIIAWLSSIDADNFKSDIMISWRQYPDTTDNPVNYAVYYIAINRATDYAHVINVVNADDYNPSSDVFSYVLQGIPHGDLISVTVTAKGGDLGVSEMSNNFTAVSIPTPDLTPRQMFNINTIESVKTPVVVTVKDGADALDIGSDGEITSIGFFHKEQHKCESFYWSMSRTVGTGTDYFGFVVPQGKTLHARMDLTALDGVIQARLFNVPFGAAGITFTGKNFCYGIANAPTPEVKAYEKVNTLTACSEANAVSSRRTAGTMTGGTPSGGKVGSTSSEGDADWAILGTGDYVLRLIGLVASDSYDMTFYDYKHGADE